jgi:nucleoside-diphosphate-sugar epimerase
MKVLVTGASGYTGNKLAHVLAEQGIRVHALIRSGARKKLFHHNNISVFIGDVQQKESIARAIEGCTQVYHTAAKVGAWAKDPSVFYDANVEGTRKVLDAAILEGVEKFVFTSSSGVLGPTDEIPLTENDIRNTGFRIDYDRSKKMAEDVVVSYATKAINPVIVSPSKVYGPGNTSHSLTANAIIETFLRKKIAFIPSPGTYKVCFAYIDDVVNGHILAMEKGRAGERYILGGVNIGYYDFFDQIRHLSKCKGRIIALPKRFVKLLARMQQINHKITGAAVRFPVKSVDHAFSNYTFYSQKAIDQLGYKITPLDEALTKTIQFFKNGSDE